MDVFVPPVIDDNEFEQPLQHNDPQDAIAALAGETVHRNPAERVEDPDELGERTSDWQYNWQFHVGTYHTDGDMSIYIGHEWWKQAKTLYPAFSHVRWQSQGVVDQLSAEQRLIYTRYVFCFRVTSSTLKWNSLLHFETEFSPPL
jgi:hypothetical protein